jgi:hypothetical protein
LCTLGALPKAGTPKYFPKFLVSFNPEMLDRITRLGSGTFREKKIEDLS